MTLEKALRTKGINISTVFANGGVIGTTTNGKIFRMESACGTFNEFTLEIEGLNRTAHCLFRTAIKKIKAN